MWNIFREEMRDNFWTGKWVERIYLEVCICMEMFIQQGWNPHKNKTQHTLTHLAGFPVVHVYSVEEAAV